MTSPPLGLTPLGFGAYPLGGHPRDLDLVRRCLRVAADAGYGWVDTGELYHRTRNELLLGDAGVQGVRLASKVAPRPPGTGLRPAEIRAACEASLRRLKASHLDWYMLHWPDESGVPLVDSWSAMCELVEAGLARWIGLSNYPIEQLAECEAARHVDLVQIGMSLVDHSSWRDVAAWCAEHAVAVTVHEPLASGLLTGAVDRTTNLQAWAGRDVAGWPFFRRVLEGSQRDVTLATLDVASAWTTRLGVPMSVLALAWVLHQPGVTSVLPGSRDPRHIRQNAQAVTLELPIEALSQLDERADRAAG